MICAECHALGYDFKSVSLTALCEAMNDTSLDKDEHVLECVVESCLASISESVSYVNSDALFTVSDYKIGQFVVECLFMEREEYTITAFLERWKEIAPGFVDYDTSMIHGLALQERDASSCEVVLKYLPKSRVLKMAKGDVRKRFDVLFAIKRKWYLFTYNHETKDAR